MRTAYGIERNFEGAMVLVLPDLRLLLGRVGILVKARIERNSRRTNAVHFHHRHNSRLHPPAACAPVQAGEESKRNHLWNPQWGVVGSRRIGSVRGLPHEWQYLDDHGG